MSAKFRTEQQNNWIEAIESMMEGRDYITYDELLSVMPEPEENMDSLESLLTLLADMGIRVLDDEQADEKEQKDLEEEAFLNRQANLENINPDDVLDVYLSQMGQEPLLTFDEEVALAKQIERGRQARELLKKNGASGQERAHLQAQIDAGQAARERLGSANTRLVVSIAKRYRGYGMPLSDLIQSGNVGLMRAVDRYDHTTGNRFSTYATWWIRQAITRSLADQSRIIRIPVHMSDQIRKMLRVSQHLEKAQGRRPTPEQIAEEMNESPDKIRQMMRWTSRPLSLEQPVGKEEDAELGSFIPDDNTPQPDEITDNHLLDEVFETLLSSLTAREARILRLRYGLQDGQTRTLKQIAEQFNLSRERIRQIEQQALSKLRLAAPKHRLRHFLREQ
jgi:RNA polymerase primary sigma factor